MSKWNKVEILIAVMTQLSLLSTMADGIGCLPNSQFSLPFSLKAVSPSHDRGLTFQRVMLPATSACRAWPRD